MDIVKEFYNKLPSDKIKINWNKNPIKMDGFLSFLTIPVDRSRNHLGSDNGWTLLVNKDKSLYITGGVVGGVEYLDCIKFGKNLSNPYNNYVNPFFLWGILTETGRKFFVDYYKDEISKVLDGLSDKIESVDRQLKALKQAKSRIDGEVFLLSNGNSTLK